MFATLLLALAPHPGAPLIQQTTTAYDGILNGNFEMEGPGEIGTTGLPVTGHFFVGAEGLVVGTTNPVLELKGYPQPVDVNHLVYQRVGVAQINAHTAELSVKVTVPNGEVAQISLTEADGAYWLLPWIMRGKGKNFFMDDPEGTNPNQTPRWKCFEVDPLVFAMNPDPLEPQEMPWLQGNPLCQPPPVGCPSGEATPLLGFTSSTYAQKPGTGWTGNSVADSVTLRTPGVGANAGFAELRWKAPRKGVVKVVSRTWSGLVITPPPPDASTRDVWHEIWLYPAAGGMELKRTDYVTNDDPNGPIIVERIEVEMDDEIRLRVFRNWDGTGIPPPPDAVFAWKPAIVYEGRSITYRLGNKLMEATDTATEEFIEMQVGPIGPVTVGPLDAGNAFVNYFKAVPRAPLEVRLMAESVMTGVGVTFDDVECKVDFEDASEAELRAEVLLEALWSRQNVLGTNPNGHMNPGILDDDNYGQQIGPAATPYDIHDLDIVGGTTPVTANVVSDAPPGLWPYLNRHYDDTDYTQFYRIREMEVFENLSFPAELVYFNYDAAADRYLQGTGNYDNGVEPIFLDLDLDLEEEKTTEPKGIQFAGIPMLLEQYERTNDVTYLELAMNYALVVANNGAITQDTSLSMLGGDTRVGILSGEQYDIDTGAQLISPLEADVVFKPGPRWQGKIIHLRATSALVQTYAAARIYNINNPPTSGPPKFISKNLNVIRDACETSILAAQDVLDPIEIGPEWRPTNDDWHGILGLFQDNWGNQAQDAVYALLAMNELDALAPFADPSTDKVIRDTLRDIWLEKGIKRYYKLWAQAVARYEFNAGDQVRGWIPIFQVLINDIPDILDPTDPELPTRAELEEQFRLSALNALKYQFADPPSATNSRSGFWTSGGLREYQLLDVSLGFGGSTGAAASFVRGLGQAYRLLKTQNPNHADLAYIRAAILAMLKGNQDQFKAQVSPSGAGYGYWPNVYNQVLHIPSPPFANVPAGYERRALDSFYRAIDEMPPQPPIFKITVNTIEAAVPVIVSPVSFKQAGNEQYVFTLSWNHASVDEDVMQDAWENRTQVTHWKKSKGAWIAIDLDMIADFTQTVPAGANSIIYTTVSSYPEPLPGDRSKFTIRTWGNYDQWNRDTSVQGD